MQRLIYFKGKIEDLKRYQIIAFNDSTVKGLKQKGFKASTITTYTGSREHTIVFYIDGNAVSSHLKQRVEFVYTALTRATNQLVITGPAAESLVTKLQIDGTNIRTLEEINQVYMYAHVIKEEIVENKDILLSTFKENVPTVEVNVNHALDTISEVIIPINDHPNVSEYVAPIVPSPGTGSNMNTTVDQIVPFDKEDVVHVFTNKHLGIHQSSGYVYSTIKSAVTRLTASKPHIRPAESLFTISMLKRGLCMATFGKNCDFDKFLKLFKPKDDELQYHALQYFKALQKKINHNPSLVKELQEEFNEFKTFLTMFNKKQMKYKNEEGFDTSDKVGQIVVMFEKNINALFSVYARFILIRFQEILNQNGRNIIIATHDSEVELNEAYLRAIDKVGFHDSWACNDFSEWDASYRKEHMSVEYEILTAAGCPKELALFFNKFRSSWAVTYRNKIGSTTIRGHEKQFSGNPFTICFNTIMNVAMCYSYFNYDNERLAMFKGDDSAVCCDKASIAEDRNIVKYTGHKLKFHTLKIGEFAGFLLTEKGIFPDVVRYTTKFLGKHYRDQQHFDEAKQSVQERVAMVKNIHQKNHGCAAISYFYPALNEEKASMLFDFLSNSRKIEFSSLKKVNVRTVHP